MPAYNSGLLCNSRGRGGVFTPTWLLWSVWYISKHEGIWVGGSFHKDFGSSSVGYLHLCVIFFLFFVYFQFLYRYLFHFPLFQICSFYNSSVLQYSFLHSFFSFELLSPSYLFILLFSVHFPVYLVLSVSPHSIMHSHFCSSHPSRAPFSIPFSPFLLHCLSPIQCSFTVTNARKRQEWGVGRLYGWLNRVNGKGIRCLLRV